jgi:DNA repair protein RecO (recombination protein O)
VASYPLRALVLRKTKLGEADLIINLLAEDGRHVRAVAKGARRTKSKFGARVEPYSVLDLLLHTGRTLEIVVEAEIVRSHEGLRVDLDRMACAAVVADLLDKASVEGQTDDRLFGLACATLDAMETVEPAHLFAVTLAFLAKAMAMLGYRPQLHACATCARDAEGGSTFSLEAGGVLCPVCGAMDASALPISCEVRDALASLLGARMSEVPSLELDREVQRACFALLREFVAYHVPARMRALAALDALLTGGVE